MKSKPWKVLQKKRWWLKTKKGCVYGRWVEEVTAQTVQSLLGSVQKCNFFILGAVGTQREIWGIWWGKIPGVVL